MYIERANKDVNHHDCPSVRFDSILSLLFSVRRDHHKYDQEWWKTKKKKKKKTKKR